MPGDTEMRFLLEGVIRRRRIWPINLANQRVFSIRDAKTRGFWPIALRFPSIFLCLGKPRFCGKLLIWENADRQFA